MHKVPERKQSACIHLLYCRQEREAKDCETVYKYISVKEEERECTRATLNINRMSNIHVVNIMIDGSVEISRGSTAVSRQIPPPFPKPGHEPTLTSSHRRKKKACKMQ